MSPLSSLLSIAGLLAVVASASAQAPTTAPATKPNARYAEQAAEVMTHIQGAFYLREKGLYANSLTNRSPDFMWGNGIMFSALVGAARHDPKTYTPLMSRFFTTMNGYWDAKVKVPGYEPSPTRGNGNDKYYDDNAWMVLTFIEAFDLTGELRYKVRANQTLTFVLSGWDDEIGGGIWWHEGHKDGSKNTCSNAPAAAACLVVARHQQPDAAKENVAWAQRIVDWTIKTLEADDGLFEDNINVATGKKNHAKLTYNTALMIRSYIGLYRATGEQSWLDKAKRASKSADWFLSKKTGAYRDAVKWSHLQIEADLEMYRLTKEPYLLDRARLGANHIYADWKAKPSPELIDNASVARTLWLLADTESDVGRAFWEKIDAMPIGR